MTSTAPRIFNDFAQRQPIGFGMGSQKTLNASDPDAVELTIKPFGDLEIYLANEAYG